MMRSLMSSFMFVRYAGVDFFVCMMDIGAGADEPGL